MVSIYKVFYNRSKIKHPYSCSIRSSFKSSGSGCGICRPPTLLTPLAISEIRYTSRGRGGSLPELVAKLAKELTPAKRHSFLVGEHENSHTAQAQLVDLLAMDYANPTVEEIEKSFGIERVTKEFFEQYKDLLQTILSYGKEKKDRTGTGTKSIFGYTLRHDMTQGFPLLTTKKIAYKSMITELRWMLKGDTNIQNSATFGCLEKRRKPAFWYWCERGKSR